PGQSPAFYAELLKTSELLRDAASDRYTVRTGSGAEAEVERRPLVDLLEAEGDTPEERLEDAVERLRDRLSVNASVETGIVRFSVETWWPHVSEELAARLLARVNEFDLNTRQTQAGRERAFLVGRVEEARADLQTVEERLLRFLEQNRRIESSPALQYENERLERQVSLQQEVYTTLAQALEQAKIEEVRDTPVITVVEQPILPAEPDERGLLLRAILAALFGLLVAALVTIFREVSDRADRRQEEEFREFQRLRRKVDGELRTLWERARGILPFGGAR
ncbi:MAG: GNVR domain-containing protein, partial [Gemmatimonadota bacterium]